MCIAILNTKKAGRLPKQQIQNSWDNNDMGAGLLWSKDNKLNVFKTYEYDEYIEKYNEIRDDKSVGNIVLHFRIATSGYNGEHNLHPFLTNDNLGFVHNGVIRGLGNKSFSDTYQFNDMLKKFNHNFIECEMTKYFISEYIGYSKLIFLDNKDRYTIINEEMGKWSSGNWYSNDSYKQKNNYVWAGNEKVSKEVGSTTFSHYYDDGYDEFDINSEDEWIMYEYLCNLYGLDPEAESTFDDIDYYMMLNDAESITDLYNKVVIS